MAKIAKVLLPISLNGQKFFGKEPIFDYEIDSSQEPNIQTFQLVKVPFRKKELAGVIVEILPFKKQNFKLRKIQEILPFCFSASDVKFCQWLAKYYFQNLGSVISLMLPSLSFFKKQKKHALELAPGEVSAQNLKEKKIVSYFQNEPMILKADLLDKAGIGMQSISNAIGSGLLCETEVEILNEDEKEFVEFKFAEKNLSSQQQAAVNFLVEKQQENKHSVTLINGVTGSGKTEVYFDYIKNILQKKPNSQILILLPEIVLTSQLEQRFENYFGVKPLKWHSDLSEKERRANWLKIARSDCSIVIATRSGLFLPFKNLACIIVDEEHDQSFKQEEQVIYHGRDMAILKGHLNNIPVVLASATPCLETIVNVQNGKFHEVLLSKRHKELSMPEIHLLDLRQKKTKDFISPILKKEILEVLSKNQQIMLFLNRRGYAPLTICQSCGYRFTCPNCSTWLVEHKHFQKLLCHHCDFETPKPNSCIKCEAEDSLVACGPGVERIAEEMKQFLDLNKLDKKITLLTKDTASNAAKSKQIIDDILSDKVQIIIGTQIIAKGHDFPNLKLVGVIDADIGLEGGDLRAPEKSFQLLHQVGGRAGRHGERGRVYLQTYNPENPVMQALKNFEQKAFLGAEIESRIRSQMPPFGKLAAIILSSLSEDDVRIFAKKMVASSPMHENVTIYGPAPAIIYKLQNRFRFRILIKAQNKKSLDKYLNEWLQALEIPRNIRAKLDIDPQSFM